MTRSTLVLTAEDVRSLLALDECIQAVGRALALEATGEAPAPTSLVLPTDGGGFHVKAAAADLGRFYFVAKTNGNFPGNPERLGLPTIQGVVVLCDATDGRPLAVLDSTEITAVRTGAATAVAARHLARPESAAVTVVGCGIQGRVQLLALARVLPLRRAFAVDADDAAAARFASLMAEQAGIPVTAVRSLAEATLQSDVCVTCTPSRRALLAPAHVRPGTFIAAVGADHPEKQELDPGLFRGTIVVVDALKQCLESGDLHHAVAAGAIRADQVHAALGEIVAGSRPGRRTPTEVTVFDSTGTALQDVAAAALVYERALARGMRGRRR
jgi:alanine dehydrogenase